MKKILLSSIIAFLAIDCLYGQRNDKMPPIGKLHGRILNQKNKPIEGATIRLMNSGLFTISNSDGEFHFDTLSPGKYQIEIFKTGYRRTKQEAFVSAKNNILHYFFLISRNKNENIKQVGRKIELTWRKNPEPDLAGYNIYRSPYPFEKNVDIKLIGIILDPESPVFIDSSPLIGLNYYAVTAFDTLGLESSYSDQICYYLPPPSKSRIYFYTGLILVPSIILFVLLFN
jgi:hypothetical protein